MKFHSFSLPTRLWPAFVSLLSAGALLLLSLTLILRPDADVAHAQSGPTVSMIPAALGPIQVTVAITGRQLPDTGGFEFDLHSDPAVARPATGVLGDFLGNTGGATGILGPQDDSLSGALAMGGYVFNAPIAPSGDGRLATVAFDVIGEGITRLAFTHTLFADPAAAPFAVTTVDGELQSQGLLTGWQLIAVCPDVRAQGVDGALASIANSYERVLGEEGSYDAHIPSDFNTLKQLQPQRGYWLRATQGMTVTLQGDWQPPSTPISLHAGWNWIGFCNSGSLAVTDALASIDGKFSRIIGDDGTYDVTIPPSFNTLKEMRPGAGYLIYMTGPGTLTYPAAAAAQAQAPEASATADADLCSGLARTPWFSEIYGQAGAAYAGQVLRAYDPRGQLVGCSQVRADGSYGLMRLYGWNDAPPSGLRFQLGETALPLPTDFRWSPEHEVMRLDFDDIPGPGGGNRVWLPMIGR